MFVVFIYDVSGNRTSIFRKIGRRYLKHVQNSVLFGNLTPSKFIKMKSEISSNVEFGDNIQLISSQNRNNIEVEIIERKSDFGPSSVISINEHRLDYGVV